MCWRGLITVLSGRAELTSSSSHRAPRLRIEPAPVAKYGQHPGRASAMPDPRQVSRRNATTARTRRWASASGGRRSFPKMLVTCFSIARSVTTSRAAIAAFESPSAISSSTSRSRGVRVSIGLSRRLRPSSRETIERIERRATFGNTADCSDELGDVGHSVLRGYPPRRHLQRGARSHSRSPRTGRAPARRRPDGADESPSLRPGPHSCASAASGCRRSRHRGCNS